MSMTTRLQQTERPAILLPFEPWFGTTRISSNPDIEGFPGFVLPHRRTESVERTNRRGRPYFSREVLLDIVGRFVHPMEPIGDSEAGAAAQQECGRR